MKRHEWYIVMNGHEARILHDLLNRQDPEHRESVLHGRLRHRRQVLDDRPTRSFSSAGGGRRSAVEPGTDALQEDKRRFLREIFAHLEERHRTGEFETLVLIAPAGMIGLWRDLVPDALATCVQREVITNLLKVPEQDLAPVLRGMLAMH